MWSHPAGLWPVLPVLALGKLKLGRNIQYRPTSEQKAIVAMSTPGEDLNGWNHASGTRDRSHQRNAAPARGGFDGRRAQSASPYDLARNEERSGVYTDDPFGAVAAEISNEMAWRSYGRGEGKFSVRHRDHHNPLSGQWRRRLAAPGAALKVIGRWTVDLAPGFFWGCVSLTLVWTAVKRLIS